MTFVFCGRSLPKDPTVYQVVLAAHLGKLRNYRLTPSLLFQFHIRMKKANNTLNDNNLNQVIVHKVVNLTTLCELTFSRYVFQALFIRIILFFRSPLIQYYPCQGRYLQRKTFISGFYGAL